MLIPGSLSKYFRIWVIQFYFSNTSVIIPITGFKMNHHLSIHQILAIQQIYEVLGQSIEIKIVYYLLKPSWEHYREFQQKMMGKMNRWNKNLNIHLFMQYSSRSIFYEDGIVFSCFTWSKKRNPQCVGVIKNLYLSWKPIAVTRSISCRIETWNTLNKANMQWQIHWGKVTYEKTYEKEEVFCWYISTWILVLWLMH